MHYTISSTQSWKEARHLFWTNEGQLDRQPILHTKKQFESDMRKLTWMFNLLKSNKPANSKLWVQSVSKTKPFINIDIDDEGVHGGVPHVFGRRTLSEMIWCQTSILLLFLNKGSDSKSPTQTCTNMDSRNVYKILWKGAFRDDQNSKFRRSFSC